MQEERFSRRRKTERLGSKDFNGKTGEHYGVQRQGETRLLHVWKLLCCTYLRKSVLKLGGRQQQFRSMISYLAHTCSIMSKIAVHVEAA
jgi:hypothetical protein